MNYTTQSEQPDVTAVQNTTASAVSEDVAPTAYTDTAVTADSEVTPTTTVQATADEDTVSTEHPMPETDTTDTSQTEATMPTAQVAPDDGTPSPEQSKPMTDTTDTGQTETAMPTAQAVSDEVASSLEQPMPMTDTTDIEQTAAVTPVAQATSNEGTLSPEQLRPMTDNTDTGQTAASTPTAQTATAQNAAAPVPILSQPASSNPFASLSGKPLPHLKGTDKATALFNYMAPNCKLYCNDQKQCYLKYDNKISGIAMLYSDEMYALIDKIITMELGNHPDHGLATTIAATLDAMSAYYGEPKTIMNRSLLRNKTEFYYCLTADRVLEIKDGVISVYNGDDIIPCNNSTFLDQIEPNLNSPAEALPGLVDSCFNVEDEYKILFIVHLVAMFLQDQVLKIPMLLLTGAKGTAKTTALHHTQALADPRTIKSASLPPNRDDFAVTLFNSDFLAVDNISRISEEYSNLLCLAITGGDYPKRVLYTTSKMVALPLKTNLAFTSITNPFEKSDLADRTDIIPMKPIDSYASESEMDDLFNAKKADLLGSIFNVLRVGLPMYYDMKEKLQGNLVRMADYMIYGAAFAKAMGIAPDQFVDAYKGMAHEIVSECADDFTLTVDFGFGIAELSKVYSADRKRFYKRRTA